MPSLNAITVDKLARLIGTAACPTVVDVRPESGELLPAAVRRPVESITDWGPALAGRQVVVACVHGHERSAGAAAYLRTMGVDAEVLEGGFEAWRETGLPIIDAARLPQRDAHGRTIWVTRARPKVDRIACP